MTADVQRELTSALSGHDADCACGHEWVRHHAQVLAPTVQRLIADAEKRAAAAAYDEARWAVHARRFDMDHGEARGPDNFYNGCLHAERAVRRLSESGTSFGPLAALDPSGAVDEAQS